MNICTDTNKYSTTILLITTFVISLTACSQNIAPSVEAAPTTSAMSVNTASANSASVNTASVNSVALDSEPVITEIAPRPLDEALPPVTLAIPAIDLAVPVVPMGWRVTEANGTRTTEWEVPYIEAGWHVNSVGTGAAGNTIISGHQVSGEAVFAPLALGEVSAGQEIVLFAEDGQTYSYRVTTVTEPIPATGASDDEKALAASYLTPTDTPQLTLMTGWPDFTTTHYLFVVADFVGLRE